MFPARHFAPRFYAGRYWPKVGAVAVAPPTPSGGSYLLRRPPRFEHETVSLILSRGIGVAVISTPELGVIRYVAPAPVAVSAVVTVSYAVRMSPVLAGVVVPAAVTPVIAMLRTTETQQQMALAEARIARALREAQDMADLTLLGL